MDREDFSISAYDNEDRWLIPAVTASAEEYRLRGRARWNNGEYERAIADFSRAIALAPDNVDAYCDRGFAYRDTGHPEHALADFTKVILIAPDNAEAYYGRGIIYSTSNRYDLAVANHSVAIRLNPDYAEAYHDRGRVYMLQGRHIEAIADFSEVIRLKPYFAEAYIYRGIMYTEYEQYEFALADFDQVTRNQPHITQAYINRGLIYLQRAQLERAITEASEALLYNPYSEDAYAIRARAYACMGEYDRAIGDITESIRCDPHDPKIVTIYRERGFVHLRGNEYWQAMRDLTYVHGHFRIGYMLMNILLVLFYPLYQFLSMQRKNAYLKSGDMLLQQGKYEDALAAYNKAIRFMTTCAEAYLGRALVYKQLGKIEQALDDLRLTIRLSGTADTSMKAEYELAELQTDRTHSKKMYR